MDIKQLEVFAYTVKYKSFSEAAKQLFLSQPTVSAHISALEKELNTRLIKRTTKDFSITPAGLRLYEYANSILKLRQKALDELSDDNKKILHIGASSVPGLYAMPEALAHYHKLRPDVTFHICNSDSIDIINKVTDGTLDVGLVGTALPDSPCTFLPFAADELVIAAPNTPHFRKLKEEMAPFSVLLKEPVILREDSSGTKREADQFLNRVHMNPDSLHVIARMNQPEAIKHCIIHGLGISIISRKVVEYSETLGQLLIFPLGEYQLLRNLYVVYRKEQYLAKMTEDFVRFLEDYTFCGF